MKKTYKDIYEPFEADIEDINGKMVLLKSVKITTEVMSNMEDIINNHTKITKDEDGKEIREYVNVSMMVNEQLVLFFGHDVKFYNKFRMSLLNDVLKDLKADTGSEDDSKKNE